MKLLIFGLTMSSSWGNGHATLWRGLCQALVRRGHEVVFFEKDTPYYSAHRDRTEFPGIRLVIYGHWPDALPVIETELAGADAAIVTSYCGDARDATRLLLDSRTRLRVFYDLDTPITLERIARGERVEYLPEHGLGDFDLVLSYTGGKALDELRIRLGARRVAPLFGSVDPETHLPAAMREEFRCDLSYIGTYARDRQESLDALFLAPARRLGGRKFLLAGAQYPTDFPGYPNLLRREHLAPHDHPAFYCSSRLTLNVTRKAMASMGYCPSGRLFEAAACGVPILSDLWEGLERFFSPGKEILIARNADDAVAALERGDGELQRIARAARERTLALHTAERRAIELERALEEASKSASHAAVPATDSLELSAPRAIWGIIPAAGLGSRIQPLAFSKELLPVGSRIEQGIERPRAVSEFLVERMMRGGANRICFVISPGKSDILEYYGGQIGSTDLCYAVQPKPAGLCDAIFRAAPFVRAEDQVLVGLPDTIWFPETGFGALSQDQLSFLLFPVAHPEVFDAVVTDEAGRVREIEVKKRKPSTHWVWGAFRMPGQVLHALRSLWLERERSDEYFGTLVNEYIQRGGEARSVRGGEAYVDVGTLNGYREAIQVLSQRGRAA